MLTVHKRIRLFQVLLSALGLCTALMAQAADVRIRLMQQQGKQLNIYHDRVAGAASGTVEVLVGATTCKPVSGEVLRPGRGGDSMTTLIVIDRGGTKSSGMGQYTEQIRDAVGGFLESVIGKGPGDKVTIVDTAGRDSTPTKLAPTDKAGDVKVFLANLPAPSGSGADVYGVANIGLGEIERAGTRLGAVIIISDGIDPAADKDKNATDNQQAFIKEAKKRGIPVASVHVDRSAERKGDDPTKFRNGRARLAEVANETNGDVVSVPADSNLAANLRKELDTLGRLFANVDRTTCQLCGKTDAKPGALVDLKVKKDGTLVAQSLPSPPPRVDLTGDDYGACDTAEAVSSTNGGSTGAACKADTDCGADSKCDGGKCVHRHTSKDLIPWIAGGLVLLAALLGLWAWRRSEKRKQEALAAEAAERERQLKEQAERSEQGRRKAEAERIEALTHAAKAAQDGTKAPVRDPALDQLLNPDVLRLAAAPGSSEGFDRVLKAGVYVIGAADDSDLRLQSGTVSSNHCQLEVERGGGARLMDLGSSNGTFVNQMRINPRQPVELRVGDVIGISRNVLLQLHALQQGGPVGPAGGQRGGRGRTMLEE